jgi:hypothetical protein
MGVRCLARTGDKATRKRTLLAGLGGRFWRVKRRMQARQNERKCWRAAAKRVEDGDGGVRPLRS